MLLLDGSVDCSLAMDGKSQMGCRRVKSGTLRKVRKRAEDVGCICRMVR